jgi:BirA family biotin operon repressor/biotin-[acetyl-CoA-carboxylase] ligase
MISFAGASFEPRGYRSLKNFLFFESVGSTNDLARGLIDHAAAEEVEFAPTLIVAEEQVGGRGRHGHPWHSPRGGLYATLFFPAVAGSPLTLVPLAAAVLTADALERVGGVAVMLKWPNDVVAAGGKLAGILTEARTRGDETHVAIGVGINIGGAGADLSEGALTLEELAGRRIALGEVLKALAKAFDDFLAAPAWDDVVARWQKRSAHSAGDQISVRLNDGMDRVAGQFEGLSPDGFLRMRRNGDVVTISSGEVGAW